FTVHHVGERVLFEIPDSLLGCDMSLMSRYAEVQTDLANGGDRMGPNMVVRWERPDDRILLRGVPHTNTADEGSALALAVTNSNFAPVLEAFERKARGNRTSVIDVTDMVLGDVPSFTLPRQKRTRFGVRSYDRDRSWLEFAKSFPINIELRVDQTYAEDKGPVGKRAGTQSCAVIHLMVLLPKEKMKPRLWDDSVGYISTQRTEYSSEFQVVRPKRYIVRYRLEPSDTAAYLRGELVDPV